MTALPLPKDCSVDLLDGRGGSARQRWLARVDWRAWRWPVGLAAGTLALWLLGLNLQWGQMVRERKALQVAMDNHLTAFSDIIGGCERIAGTPIPFSYNVLLHRTIYIYCFLLPLGFANSLGWYAPFIITFVAYTFTALEAIADELEDPFGNMQNDLPLDAISANIERTIAEIEELPVEQKKQQESFFIT